MKNFVWDTSAIINIKELDENGYSPAFSLMKDLSDGWIEGPYRNIFPSLAVFEVSATVSRKRREGNNILREFYLRNENSILYNVDSDLISKSHEIIAQDGFKMLRGADLIFACIAYIEKAYLVTLDNGFSKHVSSYIHVIDLNESRSSANYRDLFDTDSKVARSPKFSDDPFS